MTTVADGAGTGSSSGGGGRGTAATAAPLAAVVGLAPVDLAAVVATPRAEATATAAGHVPWRASTSGEHPFEYLPASDRTTAESPAPPDDDEDDEGRAGRLAWGNIHESTGLLALLNVAATEWRRSLAVPAAAASVTAAAGDGSSGAVTPAASSGLPPHPVLCEVGLCALEAVDRSSLLATSPALASVLSTLPLLGASPDGVLLTAVPTSAATLSRTTSGGGGGAKRGGKATVAAASASRSAESHAWCTRVEGVEVKCHFPYRLSARKHRCGDADATAAGAGDGAAAAGAGAGGGADGRTMEGGSAGSPAALAPDAGCAATRRPTTSLSVPADGLGADGTVGEMARHGPDGPLCPLGCGRPLYSLSDWGPQTAVPPYHMPQLQLEALCLGPHCEGVNYVSVSATKGVRIWWVPRDDGYIGEMLRLTSDICRRYAGASAKRSKAGQVKVPDNFSWGLDGLRELIARSIDLASRAQVRAFVPHDLVQRSPHHRNYALDRGRSAGYDGAGEPGAPIAPAPTTGDGVGGAGAAAATAVAAVVVSTAGKEADATAPAAAAAPAAAVPVPVSLTWSAAIAAVATAGVAATAGAKPVAATGASVSSGRRSGGDRADDAHGEGEGGWMTAVAGGGHKGKRSGGGSRRRG